jgi:hypothetical protein
MYHGRNRETMSAEVLSPKLNAAPGIRSDIEVLKRLRKLSVSSELKS